MDLRVIWSSLAQAVFSIAFAAIVAVPCLANAAVDPDSDSGLIEVEYPVEALLPYRERRPKNQLTLNFQYENFAPNGFISPSYSTPYPETYQSKDTPILSGSIGWKHNVPFVGLEVAGFYGNGGLADTQQGETVTLDVTKYGMKFGAYMDTLFPEPYVVPYANVQLVQWSINENSAQVKFNRETAYAVGFQVGALIQLNWLEPSSSLAALNEGGLTNTFIDVFAQQYGDTADSSDPKLATDFNWGVGFRVEY